MPYPQFNHSSGASPSPSSPTTQTAIRQSKLPDEGLFENKLFKYGENIAYFEVYDSYQFQHYECVCLSVFWWCIILTMHTTCY